MAWRSCLLVCLCLLARVALADERVSVYTNVDFAPLVIDAEHGLYPDLVAYLNRHGPPGLQFHLEPLPRKRMQVLLDENQLDGIIIGMMPRWFADEARSKYLWTEPFFHDSFVLAALPGQPVDLDRVREGLHIGVTLGYVYPGIDEWIAAHRLQRSEAPSEAANLDKLALGRIDAAVVTGSVLRYYLKMHALPRPFAMTELPGQKTERRILLPQTQRALFERLAPVVRALADDPEWQRIRAEYD